MPKGTKLTQEQIAEVKHIKAEYPEMSNQNVGRFVGISESTVVKILKGDYDPKPEPKPEPKAEPQAVDMTLLTGQLNTIANRVSQVTELQRSVGGAQGEVMKDLGDLLADIVALLALNTQAVSILGEIVASKTNPNFNGTKEYAANRRDRCVAICKKAREFADD